MQVGDERCLVDSYEFDVLAAVISHFKFVAGMNVGEKRRSQLGSCDYQHVRRCLLHVCLPWRLSGQGEFGHLFVA